MHLMVAQSFNLALMRQCCHEIEECVGISLLPHSFPVLAHKESSNACFKYSTLWSPELGGADKMQAI